VIALYVARFIFGVVTLLQSNFLIVGAVDVEFEDRRWANEGAAFCNGSDSSSTQIKPGISR
jgi:hypothetical protein